MQITTRAGSKLTIISTGKLLADGGCMFGRIPKSLWQEHCPADAANNVELAMNVLLIERPDGLSLIDAGAGSFYTPAERAAYGLLAGGGRLPERVDNLILSHLHFDHCGGIHDLATAATYVSRTEWQAALEPDELSLESIRPVDLEAIQPSLKLVDAPGLIAPGIEIIFTPGHTAGHLSVLIDNQVLFAADLLPTAAHFASDWIMAYDLYPLETLKQKLRILDQAERQGWQIVLPHTTEQPLVTARRTQQGYEAQPSIIA